ncbi:MAG: tol-pal system-associated acyl-CoA thioesterase [Casimicrobiaceae bacterium]
MTAARPRPFRWPVRVYYEDTDANGVVYYANYLKYLERARTEWIGAMAMGLRWLEGEHGAVFVVHRLEIDYLRPARLGDTLDVTVAVAEHGGSRLAVLQQVLRDGEVLADARVALACVRRDSMRPARIPAPLIKQFEGEA